MIGLALCTSHLPFSVFPLNTPYQVNPCRNAWCLIRLVIRCKALGGKKAGQR